MSTITKPIWRTAQGQKEDDFDAIWLYENTREWTFSVEDGIVTLHYFSSNVMPERKGVNPVIQEKQFCRNCGKRDKQALKAFWEPGLCMECHRLPVIGICYDVFTGKRIEPASDYTIDRCARCNKVKRITGNYHGTLTNGLTYAPQWCSCPATKHDGKLDTDRHLKVYLSNGPYASHIGIENAHRDTGDEEVLSPKQALSLLAWLLQEQPALQALVSEDGEGK